MSDHYMLYVYRSTSSEDINTLEKVRKMSPVIIIDESIAEGDHYEILDDIPRDEHNQAGISYVGPEPSVIPTTEYEIVLGQLALNDYTYVNTLTLNPLPTKYNGKVFYYSVIGVDLTRNIMTHLSKVSGILVKNDYESGNKLLYENSDPDDEESEWKYLGATPWSELIKIGNVNDNVTISRWGIPVVETVPKIDVDKCSIEIAPSVRRTSAILSIQNPWHANNKDFNFRKLKSYKLKNTYENVEGYFSIPTYQSLLPCSIEKMIILYTEVDNETEQYDIPINSTVESVFGKIEIIRKEGLYYNRKDHKKLGVNKYLIPKNESVAVFNEASIQEDIKIQFPGNIGSQYLFTIYLIDVYGAQSEPTSFISRT